MDMLMRWRWAIVASGLVSITPALAGAQMPGMGALSRRLPAALKRDSGITVPPTINIVNLVIQHRPELALTDTQFVRILAIKRSLDSTNAPLYRRIDSVQRLFKGVPIFSQPSPAHRDSVNAGSALVKEMTADIDDNIADAKDKVFALLSTPQKEQAEQIEDKAKKASASAGRGRL
jgi:hypothetical protein